MEYRNIKKHPGTWKVGSEGKVYSERYPCRSSHKNYVSVQKSCNVVRRCGENTRSRKSKAINKKSNKNLLLTFAVSRFNRRILQSDPPSSNDYLIIYDIGFRASLKFHFYFDWQLHSPKGTLSLLQFE